MEGPQYHRSGRHQGTLIHKLYRDQYGSSEIQPDTEAKGSWCRSPESTECQVARCHTVQRYRSSHQEETGTQAEEALKHARYE